MRKLTYLAVLEPSATGFGVYFPDLLGCISCGNDFDEAAKNAKEALELHIYGMEKDGEEIPQPSKNPQIEPETTPGYILTPVTIYPDLIRMEMDNKAVKTTITIPSWLKEVAETNHVNFSKLMQVALLDYLELGAKSVI